MHCRLNCSPASIKLLAPCRGCHVESAPFRRTDTAARPWWHPAAQLLTTILQPDLWNPQNVQSCPIYLRYSSIYIQILRCPWIANWNPKRSPAGQHPACEALPEQQLDCNTAGHWALVGTLKVYVTGLNSNQTQYYKGRILSLCRNSAKCFLHVFLGSRTSNIWIICFGQSWAIDDGLQQP